MALVACPLLLPAGGLVMKRTALTRRTPLRAQSKRRKAEAVVRRALVAQMLDDRPFCEIQWDDRCEGLAVEVDELLGRGVGGSFLAEDNCQTTCRYCHRQKHLNPAEAVRRGFTIQRRETA